MNVITISELRKHTKKYFDQIVNDHDILITARSNGQSVVTMPLEKYNGLTETEYLLSNPANAAWLKKGLAEAKAGKTIKKTLEELKQYE